VSAHLPLAARAWLALVGALLVIALARPARAHDFTPGVLALVEIAAEPGSFEVAWTEPVDSSGLTDRVHVYYPEHCTLEERVLRCGAAGLSGAIRFEGIPSVRTKVVVTVAWSDGRRLEAVATESSPAVDLGRSPSTAWQWIGLGAEHVFTGLDHVAFVIGLFLVVGVRRGTRRLVGTVTAFTVAHSVTLALAARRVIELPREPVEAMIAASIVLVAREALSERDLGADETLTRSRPWLVAFLFGLVHGLGFAGALGELPLAPKTFGVALLSFNVGIELAQLAVLGALLALRRLGPRSGGSASKARTATCYALGAVGAFWFVGRTYLVLKR